MTFRQAAKATPAMAPHFKPGLQALRRGDRKLVDLSDTARLDGSVDLDRALRRSKPNDPRWDYGVGTRPRRGAGQVTWIEIHPASSSHVEGVLEKLRWLHAWLKAEAPVLRQVKARFVWLATGSVALPANSPKLKLLAAEGL